MTLEHERMLTEAVAIAATTVVGAAPTRTS
jgi:hypothetical protein